MSRPVGMPPDTSGGLCGGLYKKWEMLVEDYTSRQLTQPADRLAAIAGLAEKQCGRTGDHYLMGLWRSNLINDLLWCVRDPAKSSRTAELSLAPSWSWVAVNSAIYFPRRPYTLGPFETRLESPVDTNISINGVEVLGTTSSNQFTDPVPIRIHMEGGQAAPRSAWPTPIRRQPPP
ncbi:hypothetical protein B0T18DRAFT_387874 [Schizothecium vesticola]|uniref:Uncharacterized protein n=1 Tax=Schizothecium vesticola TaxID=314040 RepID=A0AA40F5Z4_9PEZI|nr:hypothetical protein B0T18DRAFT_387874 [Schizothecium vesticola]